MIHQLKATEDTRLSVMADEDAWCDIVVAHLVEGIHGPVDLVVRLPGSRYPKRITQSVFLVGYQAHGFFTLIQDAPSKRSDWRRIECHDFLPTYTLLSHPRDVAEELGEGDFLAVEIGVAPFRDMVRQLQAWPGLFLIPHKMYSDPFQRGDRLRAPYE